MLKSKEETLTTADSQLSMNVVSNFNNGRVYKAITPTRSVFQGKMFPAIKKLYR